MWNEARTRCVTYNGEIYNYIELRNELRGLGHAFRANSDTEVLLAAYDQWGVDAFSRFNGFFAFAIADLQAEELVLVRDRFGVKPLFYVFEPTQLAYASTANILAKASNLEPDLVYVAGGLRYGFFADADTAPFLGMRVVRPGTSVHVTVGDRRELTARERKYYDPEARVEALIGSLACQSEEAQVAQVADLLEDSVRLRLRSDVPIAISLSGGLDSTSIATIAHSISAGSSTGYCFGHPSDQSSEGRVVESFAREAGLKVHFVNPSPSEIVDSFLPTLAAQGAPFASGSVMAQYILYRRVHQDGVRVLLGGQGADEALMGYRKFYPMHLAELLRDGKHFSALRFLVPTMQMLWAELPQAMVYWHELYRYRPPSFSSPLDLPDVPQLNLVLQDGEDLWRRQLRDITAVSLPTLLRYEDRNSMAHSVESRLPYVDYRLMELAVALPTAAKLRNGYGKWILRRAMAERVPPQIRLTRLKRGFDVRQTEWIDSGLGDEIRRRLDDHAQKLTRWLRKDATVASAFSDERLKTKPRAFAEATSLLWLARPW